MGISYLSGVNKKGPTLRLDLGDVSSEIRHLKEMSLDLVYYRFIWGVVRGSVGYLYVSRLTRVSTRRGPQVEDSCDSCRTCLVNLRRHQL